MYALINIGRKPRILSLERNLHTWELNCQNKYTDCPKDFFCQFFNKYYFYIKGNKWLMNLNVILFYFKFQISHKNWIKSQQNSWEHISWNVLWVLLLFDRALLLLNCTETEVTFSWKSLLNMGNITWINEGLSITWVKKRKTTES